jgi:hypothetical protein
MHLCLAEWVANRVGGVGSASRAFRAPGLSGRSAVKTTQMLTRYRWLYFKAWPFRPKSSRV